MSPTLINNYLTGTNLVLFGGDYLLHDVGAPSALPARIIGGSGNQTIIGAISDTITGGSGAQVLVATDGFQMVTPGTGATSVIGGVGDTVLGNHTATATTTAQIVGTSGLMRIMLGEAGIYTVSSGAGDTITAETGNANVTISGASGDIIDLTSLRGNARHRRSPRP